MVNTPAGATSVFEPSRASAQIDRPLRAAGIICTLGPFAALLIYLFTVAIRLQIDFWDSFDIFLNGRSIAEGGKLYSRNRAPLMPAVYAAIEACTRHIRVDLVAFRTSHVFAVVFYALLCIAAYKLMRLYLSSAMALAGAAGMAFNGLLIHYAPMFKEDVIGALLTTVVFYLYLSASRKERDVELLWCGLFMGLAGAAKYALLPLTLAAIGIHELIAVRPWRRGPRTVMVRFAALVAVPVAVILLFASAVYCRVGRSTFWDGSRQFVVDFRHQAHEMESNLYQVPNSAIVGYEFVFWSLTPAVACCAIVGIVVACRRLNRASVLLLLWVGIFFVAHTYGLKLKEARYYFPIYPPLYLFAVQGASALIGLIQRQAPEPTRMRLVTTVVVSALFLYPAVNAFAECLRLTDPIYTVNFERNVSDIAARMAGAHQIYWVGPYYPIHPQNYVFRQDEKYTSIYHFWMQPVIYYVRKGAFLSTAPGPDGAALAFSNPAGFETVHDGDVFIFNPEFNCYTTADLPAELQPLRVVRVRGASLERSGQPVLGAGRTTEHFRSLISAGPTIDLTVEGGGRSLRGSGAPAGWIAIRLQSAASDRTYYSPVGADGSFGVSIPGLATPNNRVLSMELRWLEPPQEFSLPTN